MKQILTSIILLTLVAILSVPATVEASSISWSVGSAFHIGGASFQIAVRNGYSGGAPYYYRTREPIHRSGYECGSACFRAEGYYYHGPSCPLAIAYFADYGYAPYSLFMSYGPRSGAPYRAYPPNAHYNGPGYYAPYGYQSDHRGSRYGYYDRRGHDRGNYRGHDRNRRRGHDRGNHHRH